MKSYIKPELNVVELSVKENMAALPAGIQTPTATESYQYEGTGTEVPLTVYNLTLLNTSQYNA